jgi:hypothetical protein
MPVKNEPAIAPQWAMAIAEDAARTLRGIVLHQDHINMRMAHDNAEAAFWAVMLLAAENVPLNWYDREHLISMVTAKNPVTVRQALKTITDRRQP